MGHVGVVLGVNTGAVLVTIGALANLLWRRIGRDEGVEVGLRRYVAITMPIVVPACVAAFTVLALEHAVVGLQRRSKPRRAE